VTTLRRSPPPAAAALRAIALNTFREAIRDRVLYLLLAFALLLIAASRFLSRLTVGSEEKIIKDLGLSSIALFGLLTAVFLGASLVHKELERRTIYTLLASPVRRWQFIGGKFLGLTGVLTLEVALMSVLLGAVLLLHGAAPWPLAPAIVLILVELGLITAFALLFSSVTNPILAALWTVAVYVTGHLSGSLRLLEERLGGGAGGGVWHWLYRLLPNLDYLDVKARVVHARPLPVEQLVSAIGYGLGYTLIVLVLASLAFQRRDFK
jgi:ABC-type transport system involved in multi-copper enzyme maturation permease subunit